MTLETRKLGLDSHATPSSPASLMTLVFKSFEVVENPGQRSVQTQQTFFSFLKQNMWTIKAFFLYRWSPACLFVAKIKIKRPKKKILGDFCHLELLIRCLLFCLFVFLRSLFYTQICNFFEQEWSIHSLFHLEMNEQNGLTPWL